MIRPWPRPSSHLISFIFESIPNWPCVGSKIRADDLHWSWTSACSTLFLFDHQLFYKLVQFSLSIFAGRESKPQTWFLASMPRIRGIPSWVLVGIFLCAGKLSSQQAAGQRTSLKLGWVEFLWMFGSWLQTWLSSEMSLDISEKSTSTDTTNTVRLKKRSMTARCKSKWEIAKILCHDIRFSKKNWFHM